MYVVCIKYVRNIFKLYFKGSKHKFKNQSYSPMTKSFNHHYTSLFPNGTLLFEWFKILILLRIQIYDRNTNVGHNVKLCHITDIIVLYLLMIHTYVFKIYLSMSTKYVFFLYVIIMLTFFYGYIKHNLHKTKHLFILYVGIQYYYKA